MSNGNRKVVVEIETRGGEKLRESFNSARASAEAMDAELVTNLKQTQKETQGLIDKEIALAREKGNSLAALELIKDARQNEFNSNARNLDLDIKRVQVQKELAALAQTKPQAPSGGTFTSQISLALETGDYTKALAINARAQIAAIGNQTELNNLQRQAIQIQRAQAEATKEVGNSQSDATRNARGQRDALFALGLALNLIISELGTNLPPAAKQAASGIKIVADAMLAGAYIGGAQGAALGAVAGVLLTVGAAAINIDPALKALNDDLDKLGKKDDAITGLSNLTGISRTNTALAFEYLKANDSLADSFRAEVKAAEPAIPVLQGIGDITRAVGDAIKGMNDTLTTSLGVLKDFEDGAGRVPQILQRGIVYYETFKDAILSGKSSADADVIAIAAMNRMLSLNQAAVGMATRDTLALAEAQRAVVASASATSLGRNLVDAGDTQRNALEDSSVQFYSRMADIAQAGTERVVAINQAYSDRIREIDDTLKQARIDAYATYQQNVIDAEINASDRRITLANELQIALADAEEESIIRRTQLNTTYTDTLQKQAQARAERLIQIQIAYQNAIRQIQDTYNLSIFNAIANQDAKALVQANMVRTAALRKEREQHQQQLDAVERQRLIDTANAKEALEKQRKQLDDALARQKEKLQDGYEKQMRALEEALRKQENKLREDYEKRIKALEAAAAKERTSAGVTRDRELKAQAIAQKKAEDSEELSYRQRNAQIERAYALRFRALATALANEKDMTDNAGRAIIDSLKYILSPEQMATVLKEFENAMQARINITVIPFSATKNPLYGFAEGGYTGQYGGIVHPRELVLPLDNAPRTQQLMQQYIPPRVMQQMPAWAQARGNASANVRGEMHVHVHLDNAMLGATVERQLTDTMLQVIPQVHQNLARGY